MENILNLKFSIWGTGKYGKIFLKKLSEYSSVCMSVFQQNIADHIKYFIDSNTEKQALKFYDKSIVSPDVFFADTGNFCVTAISNRKEIFHILEKQGLKKGTDYISFEAFLYELKQEILRQRQVIFEKYGLHLRMEEKNFYEDSFHWLLRAVKESFQELLEEENTDPILKYIIFSLVIEKWRSSPDKAGDFEKIREYFEDSFLVAAYAWYFEFQIREVSECLNHSSGMDLPHKRSKQTIGIFVRDYYGGGIEKTVSLLIPLYVRNGHKVVLITDSYMPDKEYDLPYGVVRHTMSNKTGERKEARLEELKKCTVEHQIDIMCFHSGYMEPETFYEMWYLKLLHIPVLMEVHSAFFPVIMTKKEVSRYYPDMYQMADQLIVLSNTDKVFWESLGCRCQYIQNPVEDEDYPEKYIYNGKDTKTIIWIGRLVQNPKRVLDIVPIMRRVAEKLPDAKLRVAGLATEPVVYHSLLKQIKEHQLENNIELCGYHKDIRSIYKDADVVLMTSESESFCNVIMESKRNGKPVVMYELPWLELLKDGRGYIAVKQKDTTAAADAIVHILSDDALRKKISVDSYESMKPFIEHDVYRDWKAVFDDVTGKKMKTTAEEPEDFISEYSISEFSIIEKKLLSAVYEDAEDEA